MFKDTPQEEIVNKKYYVDAEGMDTDLNANDDKEISDMSEYTSASTIAYNICNSNEATGKYTSADTAIPTWYKGVLGRNNTSSEINNIKNTYTTKGRVDALKAVINSTEFKNYCNTNNLVFTEL